MGLPLEYFRSIMMLYSFPSSSGVVIPMSVVCSTSRSGTMVSLKSCGSMRAASSNIIIAPPVPLVPCANEREGGGSGESAFAPRWPALARIYTSPGDRVGFSPEPYPRGLLRSTFEDVETPPDARPRMRYRPPSVEGRDVRGVPGRHSRPRGGQLSLRANFLRRLPRGVFEVDVPLPDVQRRRDRDRVRRQAVGEPSRLVAEAVSQLRGVQV